MKSRQRIIDHGEVFTPPALVNQMLDLVAHECGNIHSRFLEPACGDGNFLAEVLRRKLLSVDQENARNAETWQRDSILSIGSLHGIDLLTDNIVACRQRLLKLISDAHVARFKTPLPQSTADAAVGILAQNIVQGDALTLRSADGDPIAFPESFDVIIGNPPYQLDTHGSGRQATALYPRFVQQAINFQPRHLTMIIPSRWFAGGMGLDTFRRQMLQDRRLRMLVDHTNSKDCFPELSISGGVCYFLWQRDYDGACRFISNHDGKTDAMDRLLSEFPVLVRYNQAVGILHKVRSLQEPSLSTIVSSINPFGFATSVRGEPEDTGGMIRLYSSKGAGFVPRQAVRQGLDRLDHYKVMVSQTTSEHAGEADKQGAFRLLSKVHVLAPGEICTFSYIAIGTFQTRQEAENLESYLKTKFARFLILQAVTSIHLSREKFIFLPIQDFNKIWTDGELYQKYGLSDDEAGWIERLMRSVES